MKFSTGRKKQEQAGRSLMSKKQERYMSTLAEGLHQSRIAVEHITNNKKQEHNSALCVDEVKNELHSCIVQINAEEKKYNVLRELVSVLKGEMTKIASKELEAKEKQDAELEKALKRLQDDIDKVSQKNNQQIAKIAILKESSNQCRSERVVYSNLFKKLEKQIKESQQAYKSHLLKTEKTKLDLQLCPSPRAKKDDSFYHYSENKPNDLQSYQNTSILNKSKFSQAKQKQDEIWLTNVAPEPAKPSKNANYLTPSNESTIRGRSIRSSRNGRQSSIRVNLDLCIVQMEEVKKRCDRVKLVTGKDSVGEIVGMAVNIGQENEEMQAKIQQIDDAIHAYEKKSYELKKMKQYERQNIFGEQDQFDQFSEEITTYKLQKKARLSNKQNQRSNYLDPNSPKLQVNHYNSQSQENLAEQFVELCQLFQMQPSSGQKHEQCDQISYITVQDKCMLIDSVLAQFSQDFSGASKDNSKILQESRINLALETNYLNFPEIQPRSRTENGTKTVIDPQKRQSSADLHIIFNKMDRFGQCEKLLDREGFYGEYRKEITKKPKHKTRKF